MKTQIEKLDKLLKRKPFRQIMAKNQKEIQNQSRKKIFDDENLLSCMTRMNLPLMVLDKEGMLVYTNKLFGKLFNFDFNKDPMGQLFSAKTQKRIFEIFDKLKSQKNLTETENITDSIRAILSSRTIKEEILVPKGPFFSSKVEVSRLPSSIQEAIGKNTFGIIFLEIASIPSQQLLEGENNRKKNDFSSVIIHEIRTPLNAVINGAKFLASEINASNADPSELKEGIDLVYENAERLNLFLEDFSDFILLESGEKKTEDFSFIDSMVRKVENLFYSLSTRRNFQLTIEDKKIKDYLLVGDMRRLYQTMMIVLLLFVKSLNEGIINIKFDKYYEEEIEMYILMIILTTKKKDIKLKNELYSGLLKRNIKLMGGTLEHKLEKDSLTYEIVVPYVLSDTAMQGYHQMSSDEKSFDFRQLRQKTHPLQDQPNTNNLKVEKKTIIVNREENAPLDKKSNPSKVETENNHVFITNTGLSHQKSRNGHRPLFQELEEITKPTSLIKKADTLLVIDDEVAGRKLVEMLLKKEEIPILFAENGKEALELLRKNSDKIKLTLMDLMLPDTTGYDLFKDFKEICPKIPVVAFTAQDDSDEVRKMLQHGFFDFLPKPFEKQRLLDLVQLT